MKRVEMTFCQVTHRRMKTVIREGFAKKHMVLTLSYVMNDKHISLTFPLDSLQKQIIIKMLASI